MTQKSATTRILQLVLWAALALLVLGGSIIVFRDTDAPRVALLPEGQYVTVAAPLHLTVSDLGSGLKSVDVVATQNGREISLLHKELEKAHAFEAELVLPQEIKEGSLEIRVKARDASLYPFGQAGTAILSRTYTVDLTPPRVDLETIQNNVNQGGACLVVYAISEEPGKTGVSVGSHFFPGFRMKSGKYACLFTFPWDMEPAQFKPVLMAADKAGNERSRSVPVNAIPRRFRSDNINLSDSFLDDKMPQFQSNFPGISRPIDIFLKVNSELRVQNRALLEQLGRQTAAEPLWRGAFLRLPNAAPRAGFADARDYYYQGRKVDHQTHLGVDLASLQAAPVPAANDGVVIETGFIGIYGNAVVLDHGMGLQTLYAHLSQIDVQKGDSVKKGHTLGRTGATGMAGGDHLHFGVIISGVPVNPVEWWDQHWINDNFMGKLGNK
ncbi:M23 family metallopeptidase [Desulfovibrio aminophilus]|uniref:M23 family metallopeptidase n=1 Tax=Desulfovibrio aminophilus TaxID=81425 RepID=UPI0003F80BD1|nr:M23 family metallopeptidase [Desulfovibrio aminophilus]